MIGVLFVDDDANVLAGLRRMLHGLRHQWRLHFAGSAAEALAVLAGEPIDVVVSDIRMPDANGVELLNQVRESYPECARIALSGYFDAELSLESARVAHQFLAKPCPAPTLIIAIERVRTLRDVLQNPRLKALVGGLQSLPSLPDLYLELIEVMRTPDASLRDAARVISRDPGMSAKVLQMVNSAFFGLPRHVGSVDQAVTLLGLDNVRGLVLSAKVFSQFDGRHSALDIAAMWQHSAQVGALARRIARDLELDGKQTDHAYMAGLLHDIGQVVLASESPDYRDIAASANRGDEMARLERQRLGCSHADVGAYLLGLWGLPGAIVEAVALHHDPLRGARHEPGPLTAVYAADLLLDRTTPDENAAASIVADAYLCALGLGGHGERWQTLLDETREVESPVSP